MPQQTRISDNQSLQRNTDQSFSMHYGRKNNLSLCIAQRSWQRRLLVLHKQTENTWLSQNGLLPIWCHFNHLTHWGRVTHICVNKILIIGSDNGLSPDRRQAIIWTNAGILLIGPLGTNFSEIAIEIHISLFKKIHLKISSAKWRPFYLGLNVLNGRNLTTPCGMNTANTSHGFQQV